MNDPVHKFFKWVFGSSTNAMAKLGTSISHLFIRTPAGAQGDSFGNTVGAPAGGVIWPVDKATHDGMSFISADSFLALYDPAAMEAYCLDLVDNGAMVRHVGADPLKLGVNLFLPKPLNRISIGLVVRTAEYGTDGLSRNVFLAHQGGPGQPDFELIAHHLAPNPNKNSTLVYDPDGAGRKGPIDDQWRVREYNPVNQTSYNATGTTVVVPPPPVPVDNVYCVAWNGFDSGVGQNRGHCLTFFGGYLARMGFVMDGPFRPSSEKYFQSRTNEDNIHAGGLDTMAKWTNGDPKLDGPHHHIHQIEPPVAVDEGFRKRVDLMFDHDDPITDHATVVGLRRGMWRWSKKDPYIEMPPCDGVKNAIGSVERTFDMIGGSEIYLRGQLGVGGINGLPYPGIHRLAK